MGTISEVRAPVKNNDYDRFREQLAYADFTLKGEIKEIRVEIGGVCVLLKTDSQELHDLIEKNYNIYLSKKDPIAEVEIRCQKYKKDETNHAVPQYFPPFSFYVYAVETILQDTKIFFVSERAYVGVIDRKTQRVRFNFFTISIESVDSCLRITLPYFMMKYNCHALLIHACSVATPIGGFLFPGKSGVGKTTIAQLAKECPDFTVLTDEISLIRKVKDRYRIFGTPFLGAEFWDITQFTTNSDVLQAIFFPVQSKQVFIRDLAPSRALVQLLPTVLSFDEDPTTSEALLDLCMNLLEHIPSREIYFSLNTDFLRSVTCFEKTNMSARPIG